MQFITSWLSSNSSAWDLFGVAGQIMFASRFLVQWIATERAKRVTVPHAFWYLSVIGGIMALIYAIHLQKIALVMGQMAVPIYMRNIYLIWMGKKVEKAGLNG